MEDLEMSEENKSKMIKGTVLSTSGTKTLVLVNGRMYYVLRNRKNDYVGETLEFNELEALMMPSYMFAIAAMAEPDLDATLDQIKDRWYGSYNK